jgi:hypothetical protein
MAGSIKQVHLFTIPHMTLRVACIQLVDHKHVSPALLQPLRRAAGNLVQYPETVLSAVLLDL